ncbi:MAG TPA: hypothetical protein VNQ73_05315 [Ilumatobacter sp.]|nr:hypothetical protein [Ilumatobacter sp.]
MDHSPARISATVARRAAVPRWAAGLAVVAGVLATSAGACQRKQPEPTPAPAELGARSLPEGAATTGLDATYAVLTATDRGECFHLVRLAADGTADTGQGCSPDGVTAVLAAEVTWTGEPRTGDYAWRAGELTVRVVGWDPLAEQFELTEYAATYCGETLVVENSTYALASGATPPDATPCTD